MTEVKKPVLGDGVITLTNVRLAFPQLYVPQTVNGEGEPAYSSTFLLPQDHPDIALIEATIKKVGFKKWGDEWKAGKPINGKPTPGLYSLLKAQNRLCIHDGDMKANYAGFAGNQFLTSRRRTQDGRPGSIDRNASPLSEADDKNKSGDFVRTSIEVWAMDNKYGQRICATLRWVQFMEIGDRFGGGGAPISQDEYEDLSMGDAPAATASAGEYSEYA